ncbi:MAG: DUF1156 domain-containing protein, partial [Planktothrix sp.]
AEKRLAEFFPSLEGETVQNYLWAHTVVCPSCQSVVPLSPNWWLSKTSNYAGKGQARKITSDWYAIKPIPNPEQKRVDFELVKGPKGKGTTIQTDEGEYDPSDTVTMARGVGKCPNCHTVIEDDVIKAQAQSVGLGHQLYAVAYKKAQGKLDFRLISDCDLKGMELASIELESIRKNPENLIPDIHIPYSNRVYERDCVDKLGLINWQNFFNPRQLLTLVTYLEIINEAKALLWAEYEREKVEAISTYLALVLDRCVDANCRLVIYNAARVCIQKASTQHALNLMWNYPEVNGATELWKACQEEGARDYTPLCKIFGTKSHSIRLPGVEEYNPKTIQITAASADSLFHIPDNSVDAIVTDPPYYDTIQYAELSDFFYVWMKRTLGDIFPDLFWSELTDKDREAVANPSRFRNMGASPDELA